MRVGFYLTAAYLVALLSNAFSAGDPMQMIVNAFIVWAPGAILAFALRNKPTPVGRYLAPAIVQAAMTYLMVSGMSGAPA